MYISEILEKKGRGEELSKKEYDDIVLHLCRKSISAVQLGAFLMSVFTRGMSTNELADFTSCLVSHSDKFRWADQQWSKLVVGKHSTGGVGDKTSHVLAPLVVSCGCKVPMISGRGIGVTGGTIDKLESIEGYSPFLTEPKLRQMMEDPGFVIIGHSENFVPADTLLSKYRQVTGTMISIPLLTSSMLSKKLIEGLHGLVLDIKVSSHALVLTPEDLEKFAITLVDVGVKLDLRVCCVLSLMDEPLGDCVGNALEMAEVFSILAGRPLEGRLGKLIKTLGIKMMSTITQTPDPEKILSMLKQSLNERRAQNTMKKMLMCQGVEEQLATKLCSDPPESCEDMIDYYIDLMNQTSKTRTEMKSGRTGFVTQIDPCTVALVVWRLGGNREVPNQPIDHKVGIRLRKHVGDHVTAGESWCTVYHNEKELCPKLHAMLHSAITVLEEPTKTIDVIFKIIE